jgi:hypothetical protein
MTEHRDVSGADIVKTMKILKEKPQKKPTRWLISSGICPTGWVEKLWHGPGLIKKIFIGWKVKF